jgi:L-fuculokinase
MEQDVYLIYDIGKTNKKVFVFNQQGLIIDEYCEIMPEVYDEDGFTCDDILAIKNWVLGQYDKLLTNGNYNIVGINFATYGASFVYLNDHFEEITPLYNYLKPLERDVADSFFTKYFKKGKELDFTLETNSPYMGLLNSGLQLYWLKYVKPEKYLQVKVALHLPQYLSFLFTQKMVSDFTSIGCHTGLYSFSKKEYHKWVVSEELQNKLAPIVQINTYCTHNNLKIGYGLHDSSAALIPYIKKYKKPFVLVSTGTWCVNLNPFNQHPLTTKELQKDCLSFLQVNGLAVKASRIFLGKEHDYQCARIAAHFNVPRDFFKQTKFTPCLTNLFIPACMVGTGPRPEIFESEWDVATYATEHEAYNALMFGLMQLLFESLDLVVDAETEDIYIDGGFAANKIFTYLLTERYTNKKITVAQMPQATALGAFLNIVND